MHIPLIVFVSPCMQLPNCKPVSLFAICRSATPPWACPVLPSRWCNYRVFFLILLLLCFIYHLLRAGRLCPFLGSAYLKQSPAHLIRFVICLKVDTFSQNLLAKEQSVNRVSSPVSSSKFGSAIEKVIPSLVVCLCSVCSRGS